MQYPLSFRFRNPLHLVDPRPWPLVISSIVLGMTLFGTMWMHGLSNVTSFLELRFILLLVGMLVWLRDVIREGTFEGNHTYLVRVGLRGGIILFIAREVMFFVAFFWAFLWSSLAPNVEIGGVWPPIGIDVIQAFQVPFLYTLVLLTSGASVTWAHHAMVAGDRYSEIIAIGLTLLLAFIFTALQAWELVSATFTISDSILGSTFLIATGFHGFHVIIGTTILAVQTLRIIKREVTRSHHFGFEASAMLWHFVDVVWLFLFVLVLVWGGY